MFYHSCPFRYPKRESPSLNPGDNFPAGSHKIRYIAKDTKGNFGSCTPDEFRVVGKYFPCDWLVYNSMG